MSPNEEFIHLMNKMGWSQSETARQLSITRGGVNGIVAGRTVPSDTLLKLFRLVVDYPDEGSQPRELKEEPITHKPVITHEDEFLRELHQYQPIHQKHLISSFRSFMKLMPGDAKRKDYGQGEEN